VGIGSALVDILVHENDEFLKKTGAEKGGMRLVDKEFIEHTLSRTTGEATTVPGGSACNTVVGISKLGGSSRFVGKCGQGKMGRFFKSSRVLSIITPDAQRSMFTYLGASSEIHPAELSGGCFNNAAIVHVEGYLLFNTDLILAALEKAREAGSLVSLDLASFTVIRDSKKLLERIINEYVDILIANQDEALALTDQADEIKAIQALSAKAEISVLKMGARGSIIAHEGNIIKIKAMGDGHALDTTGAGDLWASGFLFGLINGYTLEKCGQLGSACGYEVCQVVGATIPDKGWQRIKKLLQ
jgi:sugar/nucleoside kinase (ribokinase family)